MSCGELTTAIVVKSHQKGVSCSNKYKLFLQFHALSSQLTGTMDTTSTVVSIGASDVIVWTLVLVVVYVFIVKRIWNGIFGNGQVSLRKKVS
jgi:hypothetical protein